MSYIGNVELKASDVKRDSGTIVGTPTFVTLDFTAANSNSLLFYLNGVKQSTSLYTIGGSPTVITLAAGTFTAADTWEAIGINDVGTLIAPADGSVTLPKISAGTGTVGQYLKTDGVGTLSWGTVAAGAADDVFWENAQTISSDYTITASKNALTAGDITVNSGITVTVPVGASWVIV